MSEEKKGVTVRVPTAGGREEHPTGARLAVHDGHLQVAGAAGNVIAIYAPGQWINAKVNG